MSESSTLEQIIAGALVDFLGYLTTRDEPIVMSGHHEVYAAHEAFQSWASSRGLSLDGADVMDWQRYISPSAKEQDGAE